MLRKFTKAGEVIRDDGGFELLRKGSSLLTKKYYNLHTKKHYNDAGSDIFEEDWDNLVILDACRYDYFREYSDIPGRLETRISRGSMTKEFIWGNFENRRLDDTVYVSSNPWYGRIHEDINSDIHEYTLCQRDAFDGIATYPSTVTDAAIEHEEEYPNKRLIVHYFQPHGPYFNEDGTERFRFPGENKSNCNPEEFEDAYVTNLKLVLSDTKQLLQSLSGKTVVTADHGELLGERLPPFPVRQYQHPPGVYIDSLVKVPWLIVDDGDRKEIVAERNADQWSQNQPEEEELDDQLAALGYK